MVARAVISRPLHEVVNACGLLGERLIDQQPDDDLLTGQESLAFMALSWTLYEPDTSGRFDELLRELWGSRKRSEGTFEDWMAKLPPAFSLGANDVRKLLDELRPLVARLEAMLAER